MVTFPELVTSDCMQMVGMVQSRMRWCLGDELSALFPGSLRFPACHADGSRLQPGIPQRGTIRESLRKDVRGLGRGFAIPPAHRFGHGTGSRTGVSRDRTGRRAAREPGEQEENCQDSSQGSHRRILAHCAGFSQPCRRPGRTGSVRSGGDACPEGPNFDPPRPRASVSQIDRIKGDPCARRVWHGPATRYAEP